MVTAFGTNGSNGNAFSRADAGQRDAKGVVIEKREASPYFPPPITQLLPNYSAVDKHLEPLARAVSAMLHKP